MIRAETVDVPDIDASAPHSERQGRRRVLRDGISIGIATGTYGLSFGALATAAGLSLAQTSALSLLMFTGASQFAFVGVIAAGGAPLAGAMSAALLGSRNALYGLHLSRLLRLRGIRRFGTAQFVIDESAAMSLDRGSDDLSRLGFWSAGVGVFVFWNIATVVGALGARLISDPSTYGLDVVAPAAFVALIAPRLKDMETWRAAFLGAAVVLVFVPFVPAGVPVLMSACAVTVVALRGSRARAATTTATTTAAAADADTRAPELDLAGDA